MAEGMSEAEVVIAPGYDVAVADRRSSMGPEGENEPDNFDGHLSQILRARIAVALKRQGRLPELVTFIEEALKRNPKRRSRLERFLSEPSKVNADTGALIEKILP